MGLERWEPTTRYIGTGEYMGDMERDDDGGFYDADDVDALLANIREALAAERKATGIGATVGSGGVIYSKVAIREARAALDALLADGGE